MVSPNGRSETKEAPVPHTQRKRGESGFYHVVCKGDGGQIVFESDADRLRYLKELEAATDDFKVEVHAYCLMDNHVHLLLRDLNEELAFFMKQINERYAMYYAKTTGRVGHVFQSRYWSEPIDSDEYYLAALRYIHANPEPPRMCKASEYEWSSYGAYTRVQSFVKTELALSLLSGVKAFEVFHADAGKYAKPFPKSKLTAHLSSDEQLNVAVSVLGRDTLNSLKGLKSQERRQHIERLAQAGLSGAEIARLTGIGRSSIMRDLS